MKRKLVSLFLAVVFVATLSMQVLANQFDDNGLSNEEPVSNATQQEAKQESRPSENGPENLPQESESESTSGFEPGGLNLPLALAEEEFLPEETVKYSKQPSSLEDVRQAINAYMESGGQQGRPRWQYEVPAEWMPEGFYCSAVTEGEDPEFGVLYYTFFIKISTFAAWSSGSGMSTNPYIIMTAAELDELAGNVNGGNTYADVYFELGADIDLSGYTNWQGIGGDGRSFQGKLDGKDFTISGLRGTKGGANARYGLFGYLVNAEIKNLNIELGATLAVNHANSFATGGLVGVATNSKITNVHLDGKGKNIMGSSLSETRFGGTGGLVGATDGDVTIEDCTVKSVVMNVNINGGGIVGGVYPNTTVKNCHVTDYHVYASSSSWGENIGGIVGGGINSHDGASGLTVDGCTVTNMKAEAGRYTIGGNVGELYNNSNIINCEVHNFEGKARYEVAGVIGRIGLSGLTTTAANAGNNTIQNCRVDTVKSTVTGGGYAAGLIGIVEGTHGFDGINGASRPNSILDCTVNNVMTSTSGNYSAGLIGAINYENGSGPKHHIITNCHVTNVDINGGSYTGGVFGVTRFGMVTDCTIKGGTVKGSIDYHGGFAGAIYSGAQLNGTSAENVDISNGISGGYAGAIYADTNSNLQAGSHVKNSYSVGGSVTTNTYGGGFTGQSWSQVAYIENCYSQVDVYGSGGTKGGFVGAGLDIYSGTNMKNCYATGSVEGSIGGSFAGSLASGKVENCFGTGTVRGTGIKGGFAGTMSGTATNCFFDTTTTTRNNAVYSGGRAGITGCATSDMIRLGTFGSWGAKENYRGKAGGTGNDNSPWYIDDRITYPYFFYQYDGFTEEETNYMIANVTYQDGVGLGQKRADFNIKRNRLPLRAISMGAVKAYFPYTGTSRYDINKGAYSNVPGGAQDGNMLYSLGGVSMTNIISFDGAPYAQKTSDRPEWDVNNKGTYTYVGDTVTYYITVWHFGTESDFKEVLVTDYIHDHVVLLPDTITVNKGESYDENTAEFITTDSSDKPYYSYHETSKDLHVNLPDMPRIHPDTEEIASYTISYKVLVEKGAASVFSDPTTYVGDIKNGARLSGDLWFTGVPAPVDYVYDFTDGNIDPVYDAFLFKFNKVDKNNTATTVEGATFSIYKYVGSGTPSAPIDLSAPSSDWQLCTVTRQSTETSLTSDDGGWVATFQMIDYPGHYMLVETSAPSGYVVSESQWLINVNGNATAADITTVNPIGAKITNDMTEVLDEDNNFLYYQLTNTPELGSITIKKYDGTNSPLINAGFAIERWDAATNKWIPISCESGTNQWADEDSLDAYSQNTQLDAFGDATLTFENLPLGKYQITEVVAPNGYTTLVDSFAGEIPTDDENGNPVYNITFEIRDGQVIEMPVSGSKLTQWTIMIIGLCILSLGSCFFIVKKLREIKHNS